MGRRRARAVSWPTVQDGGQVHGARRISHTAKVLAARTVFDDATVLLWHERIGHAGNSTLAQLHSSTEGTPFTKSVVLPHECEHCLANKAIRRHLAAHGITATRVGLTHIDVHGPYAEDIFFGARYDVCFCDDFSNVRFVMSIPDRVWATQQQAFLKYNAFINFYSGSSVNVAGCQFDNALEYEGVESEEFCDDAAIQRLFSVRYRPAQHGKAESTWRIYYPRVRACLNRAMPPEKGRRFRALAMQHLVNYVGNRLPNKSAPSNVAPMTVLCGGKVQTLRWARVLFCCVWTFVPVETRGLKSLHHMDPVARLAIHCGVAHNHKGWLAYHEDDGTFEAFIDGVVDQARLIGHGNKSVDGTHFFDMTAQVERASSVRTIISYAAQYNLTLTAGDVPTAFLQSYIHNVIILSEQAPGFEVPGPNGEPACDMVVRWDRALYGWVPSCYEWGEEFYDWLVSYGAVACYSDPKVFVLVRDFDIAGTSTRAVLNITLHVNDLLMAHSHVQLRDQFMRDNPYKIKDLGAVSSIIGADIHQNLVEGFVKFSLSTYIQSSARRFDITAAGCDLPASEKLIAACREPVDDREFEECALIFLKISSRWQVSSISSPPLCAPSSSTLHIS